MSDKDQNDNMRSFVSKIWWLVLLSGILVLGLGILLITKPMATLVILVHVLGIFWFIDGLFTLFEAIRGRKSHKDWGWGVFVAIISILAGLFVFLQPLAGAVVGMTFLIYLVAIMILISGVWSILTGIRLRRQIKNEWSMILGGFLYVIFALLLLGNPILSGMIIVWLVGLFALIGGISLIVFSFRLRHIGN